MKKALWTIPVAAAGVAVARKAGATRRSEDRAGDRWLTVTVNRPVAEVRPDGELPGPLQRFAQEIDVRVAPAPGDRGTELAARFKEPTPAVSTSVPARLAGRDPRQDLRRALREAKALLEAGEVLRPDAPPTTRPTPGGKLIGLLGRRSGGEGVL
ncbi:hypothetical protein [Streptomyces prasinopilosus]|uniref:Uncharacterized protein n=1 Tax=Streptomyces prasinopilosus TaxID=67344 RepID=A0A1G6TP66_9ACTN|nr:hypothetical protein [Streptomyces prasinopilosus]SDD30664.1 hypothetical protein SAMN05216505_106269 [Streptomyces prasinopilosus]